VNRNNRKVLERNYMERLTAAQVNARGPRPGQSTASYTAELYAAVSVDKKLGVELPGIASLAQVAPAVGDVALGVQAREIVDVPVLDAAIEAEAAEIAAARPAVLTYY
jgi:hypothetical protein